MTLDDLGYKWTVVARRREGTDHYDIWEWKLPDADVKILREDVQVRNGANYLMATKCDRVTGTVIVAKRRSTQCRSTSVHSP